MKTPPVRYKTDDTHALYIRLIAQGDIIKRYQAAIAEIMAIPERESMGREGEAIFCGSHNGLLRRIKEILTKQGLPDD